MADIERAEGRDGDSNLDAIGDERGFSRRQFISGIGALGVGMMFGGIVVKGFLLPDESFAIPVSGGYLLVDTMKCSGCDTCMLACSVTHHGRASLSLSRLQVQTDPFAAFPEGIVQNQCRQCPSPACMLACPTGALHVDTEHGNVRTVDPNKCVGCERCIGACPFTPTRVLWNHEDMHSQKCDLCANTPFWNEEGGAEGKQACVEYCPMHAIAFTTEVPLQNGVEGYQVNLRKDSPIWGRLGFPTTDSGEFAPPPAG